MKELSIEEKAKAYDKVREKIAVRFGTNVAEEIFSEFEESEDERIRKGLINYFNHHKNGINIFYGIKGDDILAWLEKQGEQKPTIEMKSAEESLGIDSNIYNEIVGECIYGEQKPAWSEEDKNFMYDTLSNLTEIKDRYGEGYGNVGKCIDWVKALKQRIGG